MAVKAAALLRGINVGGRRKVGMPELREALAAAGCTGVSTLLNSGNVVLDDTLGSEAETVALLERTIAARFSLTVPVVLRTGTQLFRVVQDDPFAARRDTGSHHLVTFFDAAPEPSLLEALDPAAYAPEEFVLQGRELHLWLPHGAGRSPLAALAWDRLLRRTGTGRNWNTVSKLRDLTAA